MSFIVIFKEADDFLSILVLEKGIEAAYEGRQGTIKLHVPCAHLMSISWFEHEITYHQFII
jgi:hypothetical protein